MPAEWQARQLAVIAWAFGPGKATSLVGRSTETDFRTNVCGALGAAGAEAATGPVGSGWPMNARIRPARTAPPNPTCMTESFMCSSRHRQVGGLDGVMHEATGVPVHGRGLGKI